MGNTELEHEFYILLYISPSSHRFLLVQESHSRVKDPEKRLLAYRLLVYSGNLAASPLCALSGALANAGSFQ